MDQEPVSRRSPNTKRRWLVGASAAVAALLAAIAFVAAPGNNGSQASGAGPPDVEAYNSILQRFVTDDGKVYYARLKENIGPLERFVAQIAAVSPDSHPQIFPARESRLAYWINAYNAIVLWAFAKDYPEDKDRLKGLIGRGLFFYRTYFTVGGRQRTLDDIEDNSLRKQFRDPRIHFAIVCASSSCPWLAREAYTAGNVDALLDRKTREFLNHSRNVQVDPVRGQVTVSKIFDWFEEDFGGSKDAALHFVARYREQDGDLLRRGEWRIRYFNYDWSLNNATAATPSNGSDPSGSLPG